MSQHPQSSQAKPDFTGTWKFNLQKSDVGAAQPPDSLVAKVEHKDDVFKYVVQGASGGRDFHEELEVSIDGKEHPGPNGAGTVTVKWDGSAIVFVRKADDGTDIEHGRFQLSPDGKVLTREVKETSPNGGANKRRELYDRQ